MANCAEKKKNTSNRVGDSIKLQQFDENIGFCQSFDLQKRNEDIELNRLIKVFKFLM